jgi:sec-independent protein translocase protein TatA
MLANGFQGWHLIILVALLVLLFGAKRLPDAARSLGKSMRIFKSEVKEMQVDGKREDDGAAAPTPIASERVEPSPSPTPAATTEQSADKHPA